VGGSSAIELLRAQLFVALAAATALLVAAMRTEWERAEDALARQRQAEERLEHMALHDPLTGLPNRALFLDRLEHALATAQRPESCLAVFFCDIDDFKNVNDGFGRQGPLRALRRRDARAPADPPANRSRAARRDRETELCLEYLPVFSLVDGRPVAAEALLRWRHPSKGLLAPSEFLGVAEESGLITELGTWVIGEACAQAAPWNGNGAGPLAVSINLSARQVADADLAAVVAAAVSRNDLDPSLIEIEITESMLLKQGDASLENLGRLEELGVKLILDDFGVGYSSLDYLRRLSLDRLKIAREFVAGLGQREEDTAIVVAILSMAHALGVGVVAEGVETEAHLSWLREHHCDFAQGFLLGRPQPPAQLRLGGQRADQPG